MTRLDVERSHIAPSLPPQPIVPVHYDFDKDIPPQTSPIAIRTVRGDSLEERDPDRSLALIRALQAMQHASPPAPLGGMPIDTSALATQLLYMVHAIKQSQFYENMDKTEQLKDEIRDKTQERLNRIREVAERAAKAQKWAGAGSVAGLLVNVGAAIGTGGAVAGIPLFIASISLMASLDNTFNEGEFQKKAMDFTHVPEHLQGKLKMGIQFALGIGGIFSGLNGANIPSYIQVTRNYFMMLCSGLEGYNEMQKIKGQGDLTQLEQDNLSLSTNLERAIHELEQALSGLQSTAKNTSKILTNASRNAEGLIQSTARG